MRKLYSRKQTLPTKELSVQSGSYDDETFVLFFKMKSSGREGLKQWKPIITSLSLDNNSKTLPVVNLFIEMIL